MHSLSLVIIAFVFLSFSGVVGAMNPLAHILHTRQLDSSYSEAYVPTISPNSVSVDHKTLLRGLNSAKRCLGKLATFDTNEYAHFDNPLQLGFIEPPTLSIPAFVFRTKEVAVQRNQVASIEGESSGDSRYDFWIPL